MWTRSTIRLRAALTGMVLLNACSEASAPNARRFDGTRMDAGVAVVEKVAAASALSSMQLLVRFAGGVDATSRIGTVPSTRRLEEATRIIARSAVTAGAVLVPVIQPSVLGRTFVYDPATRRYIIDPARTGAPANGVRFILYDETSTGDPIVGREIGHADLTDDRRTSPNVAAITLVAVTGGVTRLRYSFELSLPGAAPAISVQGYVVDGDDHLDFTVHAGSEMLAGGRAVVQATLVAPTHGFEVSARMSGIAGQELGDGDVDLTVRSGSDEIVVDASVISQKLDATFRVNGNVLARASGNPKNPVISGEGGRPLTEEELRALGRIVEMSGAIFKFVCDLIEPAGRLLLFALGLGA